MLFGNEKRDVSSAKGLQFEERSFGKFFSSVLTLEGALITSRTDQ